VPCDLASYNEVRTDAGSMTAADDPPGAMTPDAPEVFVRLAHQNPIYAHYQKTRDGRPYKWSDFFTRRELHATDLYREAYNPMRVEYQMAFCLPAPPELVIGLALNRERRDFGERDREVLNLIRAPMIAAYATVERYATVVDRLAAVERGLARDGAGLVVLASNGGRHVVSFATEQAADLLDLAGADDAVLPGAVASWVAAIARAPRAVGESPAPLLIRRPRGGTVSIEFMRGRRSGEADSLIVEPVSDPVAVETLRAAGLTARQAEVLRAVALGRTNAQIADQLTISVRTVSKHLEHIYEQLGATSRTQAAATAWSIDRRRQALAPPSA
jgi:DNA-binding CsgD family transcriptional regulator